MSKTKHLDAALDVLRDNGTARRAKGTTFTLTRTAYTVGKPHEDEAILQGPRGKMVARYSGLWNNIVAQAQAHVARLPGATLTIYE